MKRFVGNGTRLKHFLLGILFATATLAVFTLMFYTVQSNSSAVDAAFKYIKESNLNSLDSKNYYSHIEAETEDKYVLFVFPETFNGIMFEPIFMRDVELLLLNDSGEQIEGLGVHDSGGRMIVDLRNVEGQKRLKVIIKKGGQLILENKPLIGKYQYLRFFSKFCYLFSGDFSLLISGMSFLLSFILFSIARVNRELHKAFLALSVATLFYGVLFLISAVILNGEGYLVAAFPEILNPLRMAYMAAGFLSMFFTVIMFYGVEYYVSKKNGLSKYLLTANIAGYILLFLGVPHVDLVIGYLNYAFFIIVAYQSGLTFFSYLAFIRPLSELQSFITHRFFQLYDFDMNNISFFVLLFGFGAFFIRDYTKNQKELNIKNEELESSNEEIVAMNEELESSYLEIEGLNSDLEIKVSQRTSQLQESMRSISTLLNNTDEGFMKFGPSLLVEPEYSKQCAELFNGKIDYSYFPVLMFAERLDQVQFLIDAFAKIFNERDVAKREIMISLLPDTFERGDRTLSAKYRLIEEASFDEEKRSKKVMVIIKDITEKVKLRDKLKNEKEIFEEIVKLIASSESFIELREDYYDFWEKQLLELLKDGDSEAEIYRHIHTLKGNFASFGFEKLVGKLHEIENTFTKGDYDTFKTVLSIMESGEYKDWLDDEMALIYDYISPGVFEKQFEIREKNEIISKIKIILEKDPGIEELECVRELLYEYEKSSFAEIFEPTKNFIISTADRLGKTIREIEVTGGGILVNKQRLKPLLKTWIHLFRNIVDHGLEDPETRDKYGKEPFGKITVALSVQGGNLILKITDDGRGINFKAVSDKAIRKGIVDRKTIQRNPEMVYDIIFMEGFSTTIETTEISGRGMGLSAVKRAVESLCGTISVESKKNRGTTFKIVIPQ